MASLKNKVEVFTVQSTVASNPATEKQPRKKKSSRYWSNVKTRKNNQKRGKLPILKSFNKNDDDSKFINGFYGLLALLILIVSPCLITFLPVNNSLANPQYWYEILFSTTATDLYLVIAGTMESNAVFPGLFKKGKIWMIAECFMAGRITQTLTICFMHLIWTDVLGYYEPFPHRNLISGNLCNIAIIARAWHSIPKQTRTSMNPTTRKRCMAYLLHLFWMIGFDIQLVIVQDLFVNKFRSLQWMIAVIAPLMKEINDRIIEKLMINSASQENYTETKFAGKILMNVYYSLWLATSFYMLTPTIEYILLATNFFINISLCYKVIRLNGKTFGTHIETKTIENQKKEILTELILNETVEILLPIAFIGAYASAYYGPNKNALWYIAENENLLEFLIPIIKMAFIDSGSLILAGISLQWFCQINILREYCSTIKRYWVYLAFWGGASISTVSDKRLQINGYMGLYIFLRIKLPSV